MSYFIRPVSVLAVIGLMVGAGGCAAPSLRGQTQSVADGSGLLAPPSYTGRYQHSETSAPTPASSRHASGYGLEPPPLSNAGTAPVRYYSSAPDAGRTYSETREGGASRPPASPAQSRMAGDSTNYQRRGLAHWIGPSWKGHKTTSGEMFDPGRLTGAHDTLPLPSFLYVTNRANGRTILIRVNDRVNAGRGSVIVVSELAADLLGFRTEGRAEVDIQYAGPAAERPNGKHEEAFLMKQPWFHRGLINVNHAPDGNGGVATASGRDRYVAPNYPRWDNTRR